ncbi:hypothetical protein BSKO_02279 [Bryopsis sp. KO-2023]|nr:hypothetical protein BSKO_02279 [Bryopsis sp. KO-2023]
MWSLLTEVEPPRQLGDLPSATSVFKATAFKDVDLDIEGVTTLFELFERSAEKFANSDCVGYRPMKGGVAGDFKFWSYEETSTHVKSVSSILTREHLFGPGTKVCIFGANCPEWMVAMQACNRMSWVCVPIYDSLLEDATRYIIEHSGSECIFVSTIKMPTLARCLRPIKDLVKSVVFWGQGNDAAKADIEALGIGVHSFNEMLENGKPIVPPSPPKPADLCAILYTSGTTGDPKGVMLSHDNLVSQVSALNIYLQQHYEFGPGDKFLSYLPLAHSFDRTAEEVFLMFGGAIGYWQGSITALVDDMIALKPTMFVGVPRVFDKVYHSVMHEVNNSFMKKHLFQYMFNRKQKWMQRGVAAEKASPMADRLVFRKISRKFGGKIRLIVTGGAPISSQTEDFLRVCMESAVVQGYGLTETCAGSFISPPNDIKCAGTVGIPMASTEFRLESVPEMNYDALAERPVGEICIRGRTTFTGYHKNPEKTAEVIGEDGWIRTGDIGAIVEDGMLKIVDRKKNIFKLAKGAQIVVEKIEEVYKKSPAIDQIWVYGNRFKDDLVAVVVPEWEYLAEWAQEEGIEPQSPRLLCTKSRKHFLEVLNRVSRQENLRDFETVKAVHLESQAFTVDNGLFTPTFKLKRRSLIEKYQKVIDELYASIASE